MKRGTIRRITWEEPPGDGGVDKFIALSPVEENALLDVPPAVEAQGPRLVPPPADAVEEARILLHIAAEVEGALLVQYLYACYSVIGGDPLEVPGLDHPVVPGDWARVAGSIAIQEMGHLITVQNLLLSLDAPPHLDRENLPWLNSELYPFPFHLEPFGIGPLAKDVAAEAPREVTAADRPDYEEAVKRAQGQVGQVSRVGQIYERLYWLFQDDDAPHGPWADVTNPFPDWPGWHVPPDRVGFNQDRQAQPFEWRGNDATFPPDTAVYVLTVADKADGRAAIYRVAEQGEGPAGAEDVDTHFDKFLNLYREFRAYSQVADAPAFVRAQATDPSTGMGGGPATITDPAALEWARLSNHRYLMLLFDVALSLSLGQMGFVPGTTARRADFQNWVFKEMLAGIKGIGTVLEEMPLEAGAPVEALRAGLPFELPATQLPTETPAQVAGLRRLVEESRASRQAIRDNFNPNFKQRSLLKELENLDGDISQKLGAG